MPLKFVVLFVLLFHFSCKESHLIDRNIDIQSINKVLSQQQSNWNIGNIDAFMEGYWKSDSLSFMGSRGLSHGWNKTLENYKKGYPDIATMGILSFETIELIFLSDDIAKMVGKYTLSREHDNPSGYFTLIWKRINGSWLIISDHTCG